MTGSKTVLITGAAARLGGAMALSLADAGWDVAIHYNTSEKKAQALAGQIRGKGRKAYLVRADLRDAKAVAGIIPALHRQKVKLSCLINNAAAFGKDSLAGLTPQAWQAYQDVNLLAPLLLTRDLAAHYKGTEGNVINITDGMLGWSVSQNYLSYAMSKLGLASATRLLARELAPNIRINAIAPGATLEGELDSEDTFAKLRKIIPLRRTSSPEEVNCAIHFLLSSPSLTGQILSLSGGMDLG